LGQLSNLVVNGVMPFYIFYTTATNTTLTLLNKAPLLVFVGAATALLAFLLSPIFCKLLKVKKDQQATFRFCMMYGNTAFLGIPICSMLFGNEGAFYAAMYNFGLTVVIYSLGVWVLSGGKGDSLRTMLLNPLAWSIVLGILFAISGVNFPLWISQPLSTIGNATLPVALLVAGAQIGNIPIAKTRVTPQLAFITFSRLVLFPGLLLILFRFLHWNNMDHQVMILQTATPVGIAATIMAKTYQADGEFPAMATLWSTLFSLVTLPLLVLLF
jgi:malate permease and related proteins